MNRSGFRIPSSNDNAQTAPPGAVRIAFVNAADYGPLVNSIYPDLVISKNDRRKTARMSGNLVTRKESVVRAALANNGGAYLCDANDPARIVVATLAYKARGVRLHRDRLNPQRASRLSCRTNCCCRTGLARSIEGVSAEARRRDWRQEQRFPFNVLQAFRLGRNQRSGPHRSFDRRNRKTRSHRRREDLGCLQGSGTGNASQHSSHYH